jgi:hypothetical protein
VLVTFRKFSTLPLKLVLISHKANRRRTTPLSESVSVCASVKGSWRGGSAGVGM